MSTEVSRSLPQVPTEFIAIGPPLARGGSAVVWRARNRITGREVALKVWLSPLGDEQDRRAFETESRRHLELPEHPCIVRWLWAAAPADGLPWLATELHGESLGSIVRRDGPYPLAAGLVVALDLLDGLAVMHSHGLVHRDVKPDNVVVSAGRAALCDLGVSMPVNAPDDDCAAGTRSYLAPELLAGGQDVRANCRTDVFSAARTIRTAVGPDVPLALDLLLTRAQSVEPLDRPADAGEFAVRLAKVTADLGCPTRRGSVDPALPVRHHRRFSRRTVIAGLVAATLLLAGACATAVMVGKSSAPSDSGTVSATGVPSSAAQQVATASTEQTAALPAARVAPDIRPDGAPVLLEHRPDKGSCTGAVVPGGSVDHKFGGATVAITILHRDRQAGTLCAEFHKAGDNKTYGKPSYLALTLCNSAGECDSDWYDYKWWAGPVVVDDLPGCASWRVSMTDVAGSDWMLKDAVGSIGC